jgi:diaminohydroxyphosphoribosylaminopyrimidine deaminase/5-amino-6-(5-phosphoribosylamino)uracil reductase
MIEPSLIMDTPIQGDQLSPAEAMKWSLILARRGAGFVSPNPMVGCVIVDQNHKFVTGGWHKKLGGPHAEIDALESFARLKGDKSAIVNCHIYVTLEPCAHQGRTGSCARTLADLKPATVTYGIQDPNPLVAGQGEKILQAAGLNVSSLSKAIYWPAQPGIVIDPKQKSDLLDEIEDLTEIFLWNMRGEGSQRSHLPFVTVKVASTLDGRVALEDGTSKWITSEPAREKGHRLRLEHDAIIVGRGTIESDNPALNVRLTDVVDHTNSIVVIDPSAKLADQIGGYQIAKVRPTNRVLICVQREVADMRAVERARERGFQVLEVEACEDGTLDLRAMLIQLKEMGLQSVYVEGGPGTIGPFLQQCLVNRLHVFMSTSILGGMNSIGWTDLCGVSKLEEMWKLKRGRIQSVGPDFHITGRLDLK